MAKITIHDVAKVSGYGIGTVSRVISGDKGVKESTRKKILKVIEDLNYIPNVNGARLRKKHSQVIALMVPIINHPFFAEFVENVSRIAIKNKYSLLLVTSQMNVETEKDILKKIRQKEVDGAIFVTHFVHDEKAIQNLPLVSVDRHLADNIPYVSSDNYDATKEAIERLIQSGAKKIGFIGTKPFVNSEVLLREKAYLDVLKEHNLPVYLKNEIISHGEEEKLVDEFLVQYQDLDAIFASGNTLSQILYSKVKDKVDIPNKLQIVAYDGVFASWVNGSEITCIQQPIKEMAEASFNILIDTINEKEVKHINIFKTKYIKGNTTKL